MQLIWKNLDDLSKGADEAAESNDDFQQLVKRLTLYLEKLKWYVTEMV